MAQNHQPGCDHPCSNRGIRKLGDGHTSDTVLNVVFGSGGILLGLALIALMLGSRGSLPGWIRWLTLICGVLALTAPFYFSAPAIPIWGIVVGAWLLVTGYSVEPAAARAA